MSRVELRGWPLQPSTLVRLLAMPLSFILGSTWSWHQCLTADCGETESPLPLLLLPIVNYKSTMKSQCTIRFSTNANWAFSLVLSRTDIGVVGVGPSPTWKPALKDRLEIIPHKSTLLH